VALRIHGDHADGSHRRGDLDGRRFGCPRAGSDSVLTLAVATLAGNATDALHAIGEAIPLGFAFGLGMAAAVDPCGFVLLPTYLGLSLPGDCGWQATPMDSAIEKSPGGERGHDDEPCGAVRRSLADPGEAWERQWAVGCPGSA